MRVTTRENRGANVHHELLFTRGIVNFFLKKRKFSYNPLIFKLKNMSQFYDLALLFCCFRSFLRISF